MITRLPNGNIGDKIPLAEVKRPIIMLPTATLGASLTAVENLTTWKTLIYTDLSAYVIRGLTAYENTTDDAAVQTAPKGQKFQTNRPPISLGFMLDSNWSDYKDILKSFQGGSYRVAYELEDGRFLVMLNSAGTYQGFPGRVYATSKVINPVGDVANGYKVNVYHDDFADFESAVIVDPDWDFNELVLAMPVGVDMHVTTAFNADDVVVLIRDRSTGEGIEDFVVADFEVVDSNWLDTPAITAAVDGDNGYYTLTLQKGAVPGSLAAGDWITFRLNKVTSSVTSYLSNLLTVVGDGSS